MSSTVDIRQLAVLRDFAQTAAQLHKLESMPVLISSRTYVSIPGPKPYYCKSRRLVAFSVLAQTRLQPDLKMPLYICGAPRSANPEDTVPDHCFCQLTVRSLAQKDCVAVKEVDLSCHIRETIPITVFTQYHSLI